MGCIHLALHPLEFTATEPLQKKQAPRLFELRQCFLRVQLDVSEFVAASDPGVKSRNSVESTIQSLERGAVHCASEGLTVMTPAL